MALYSIATKTRTTGKLRSWTINARNMTNAKKRFSKRKFIILSIKNAKRGLYG